MKRASELGLGNGKCEERENPAVAGLWMSARRFFFVTLTLHFFWMSHECILELWIYIFKDFFFNAL